MIMALTEYKKIDLNTGKIIETYVLNPESDVIPEDYIQGWGSSASYFDPVYDFMEKTWKESKPQEEFLQMAKEQKLQELGKECNREILGRFIARVEGVDYEFSNDIEAQMNFDKTDRAFDKGRITEIMWTCYLMDGTQTRVLLNPTNFEAVYMGHLSHVQNNIIKFRDTLQPQVISASTVEEVGNINWSGSPLITPEPIVQEPDVNPIVEEPIA